MGGPLMRATGMGASANKLGKVTNWQRFQTTGRHLLLPPACHPVQQHHLAAALCFFLNSPIQPGTLVLKLEQWWLGMLCASHCLLSVYNYFFVPLQGSSGNKIQIQVSFLAKKFPMKEHSNKLKSLSTFKQ